MQVSKDFFKNKKVFITGHTGFKGAWLCLCLKKLGALIYGYALPPDENSLFNKAKLTEILDGSTFDDINNYESLKEALKKAEADFIFHLAAQSSVREGFNNPVSTYKTNVMGTVNLLSAVKENNKPCTIIVVTSDKCYFNNEQTASYNESSRLGGAEPYAGSKACCELVCETFRNSYFPVSCFDEHGISIATARSCNVIGGGDMQQDRLLPSIINSLIKGEKVIIRNPDSVRPWQHVLDSLGGYLLLAEKLGSNAKEFSGAWNFGPSEADIRKVSEITEYMFTLCGKSSDYEVKHNNIKESALLMINSDKSRKLLNWKQVWNIEKALCYTYENYKAFSQGEDLRKICISDIENYYNSLERMKTQ